MKKIIITFVAVFIFYMAAFAQDKSVNNLENNLLKITSLSADFVQTNNLKDFGEDIYKGKVYIIMKDKAIWDYTEPYKSWYLFTKDSISQYDEINNQLVKFSSEDVKENVLLQVIMDIQSIKKNFSSKVLDKNTIRFIPKKDYGIKHIDIAFNNGNISTLKSIDKSGNSTEIILKNLKTNIKINEKVFNKKLPKDVNIFEN